MIGLSNVRHILELRNDLISLGALDTNGYKYTTEGGLLRVIKDALVVMRG